MPKYISRSIRSGTVKFQYIFRVILQKNSEKFFTLFIVGTKIPSALLSGNAVIQYAVLYRHWDIQQSPRSRTALFIQTVRRIPGILSPVLLKRTGYSLPEIEACTNCMNRLRGFLPPGLWVKTSTISSLLGSTHAAVPSEPECENTPSLPTFHPYP